MKKNFYYGLAFILSLGVFSSCSDDNNGNENNKDKDKLELLEKLNTSFKTNDETKKLELTYSEAPMLGKTATFTSKDGITATIELTGNTITELKPVLGTDLVMPGVIPGETTTTLNVELTDNGEKGFAFKGKDEANGRIINYNGEIVEGKMTLSLNAELEKNDLTGSTWDLRPYDILNGKYPFNLTWETEKKINIELFPGFNTEQTPTLLLRTIVSLGLFDTGNKVKLSMSDAIAKLLQSLSFQPDGNIIAKYSDAKNLTSPVWQDSPLNLIHYTVKEGKIYAFLNVEAIMALAKTEQASSKSSSAIVPELMKIILPKLPEIIPMLSNGIPLGYKIEGDTPEKKFTVFIDNEVGMILNEIIIEVFKNKDLVAAIKEMMKNDPDFASMAGKADPIFEQGAEVFGSTTQIELGLNFDEPTKAE